MNEFERKSKDKVTIAELQGLLLEARNTMSCYREICEKQQASISQMIEEHSEFVEEVKKLVTERKHNETN